MRLGIEYIRLFLSVPFTAVAVIGATVTAIAAVAALAVAAGISWVGERIAPPRLRGWWMRGRLSRGTALVIS